MTKMLLKSEEIQVIIAGKEFPVRSYTFDFTGYNIKAVFQMGMEVVDHIQKIQLEREARLQNAPMLEERTDD